MKKYLVISLFGFYSSACFSQIYGVGNGSGQASSCVDWDFGLEILPVNLISFDASCSGSKTILQWSTPSGLNIHLYNIERSADGINFQSLGNNYTRATYSDKNHFSFTDETSPAGRSYYRLKQTGRNGQIEYSQVVSAGCNTGINPVISIYPNPASDLINIKTGTPKAMLILRNSLGQPLFQVQAKSVSTTIDLDPFPQGVYYIEINTPGKSTFHKVVLARN
jgi:hypothetical protein